MSRNDARYDALIATAAEEKESLEESLAPELLSRINLIRHAFSDVMPDTLLQVVERFRRDANLDRELAAWEAMAAVYLDFKQLFNPDAARGRSAFLVLLELSMGRLRSRKKPGTGLSMEEFRFLCSRWDVFGSRAQATVKIVH